MTTIRLTAAQALVYALAAQCPEIDARREPLFGQGNVQKWKTLSKALAEMRGVSRILLLAPGIKRFLRPSTEQAVPTRGCLPKHRPVDRRKLIANQAGAR